MSGHSQRFTQKITQNKNRERAMAKVDGKTSIYWMKNNDGKVNVWTRAVFEQKKSDLKQKSRVMALIGMA
jgi:hypothetical protein